MVDVIVWEEVQQERFDVVLPFRLCHGVADGDGEQEPIVLGASAAVSSEEDREENPIQAR